MDVNGTQKTKDASQLTESDLRQLLERAYINREFDNGTYLPLRANTPQFFRDVVREYTSSNEYDGDTVDIKNYPMAMTVEHIIQNMEEDDGTSYGDHRPHSFDEDEMVDILKAMGDPQYIVLQKNKRFAEVVSVGNRKVVVSIDTLPDNNSKAASYMNGYNSGYYNIIVTEFEPDDLNSYLYNSGNTVIYDKRKMNGSYHSGSGRIVTVAYDNPFINDIVTDGGENVNKKVDSEGNEPASYLTLVVDNKAIRSTDAITYVDEISVTFVIKPDGLVYIQNIKEKAYQRITTFLRRLVLTKLLLLIKL